MRLSQLRYFVALGHHCNYTKAAEELFIAQSTLSQQINKLEEELGVQLFERSTRNVILTPIGQECIQWARKTLEAASIMVEVAQEKNRRDQSHVSLGVLAVYPMMNVPNVLKRFQEDSTDIHLNLTFANSVELVDMLLRKKIDAVIANIASDAMENETLDQLLLDVFWDDRLHVVVGEQNTLYKRNSVTLEDILDEHFLFNDLRSSVRLRLHQALRVKGYALPECSKCPSLSSMFNYIQKNMGISVMTAHVAESYLLPRMKCIPIDPPIKTQTALIMRKKERSPALKQFADYFHVNLERTPL